MLYIFYIEVSINEKQCQRIIIIKKIYEANRI